MIETTSQTTIFSAGGWLERDFDFYRLWLGLGKIFGVALDLV
jgi:hypothetical protein